MSYTVTYTHPNGKRLKRVFHDATIEADNGQTIERPAHVQAIDYITRRTQAGITDFTLHTERSQPK